MSEAVAIIPLRDVSAHCAPVAWPFVEERADEVAAIWARETARRDGLFDGTVLLQHEWRIEDGVYHTRYSPVRYRDFIAWPILGKPDPQRRNGFAMAALRAADGPFVLGVMGSQTFNAGKIYFPAGTPDMDDVLADGSVDLAGSMVRELMEETALRRDEFVIAPDWTLALDGHRAAFMRSATLVYPADEARRMILDRLSSETDGELADIAIVRGPDDIDPARIPAFASAYMMSVFAGD